MPAVSGSPKHSVITLFQGQNLDAVSYVFFGIVLRSELEFTSIIYIIRVCIKDQGNGMTR